MPSARTRVVVTRRLPEPVEAATYYVVSEALTNAAKHSSASAVRVEVDGHDGFIQVSIRDDGVGGAAPGQGSGLIGLTLKTFHDLLKGITGIGVVGKALGLTVGDQFDQLHDQGSQQFQFICAELGDDHSSPAMKLLHI